MTTVATDMTWDQITLEILWARLISLTDEAAAILKRMSFSIIVREANDFACVLMDRQGNAVAQSQKSVPSFIGTLPRTMRSFLEFYPVEKWEEGDVVITNDPWLGTGQLPDLTIATPIYHRGRLVGFFGSIAHTPDIGGMIFSADAREMFEEGLRIPVMKLFRQGVPNEDLFKVLRANVRVPEQVVGDLLAQVGAGDVAIRGLNELLEENDLDDFQPLADAIISRSEQSMRDAIRRVPDGVYEHTIHTDGMGEEITIACRVIVDQDEITIDYSGSSPQVNFAANSCYNYTYSYTAYPVKCVLNPNVPNNEGAFRPVKVIAEEGSILNPRFPASGDARMLTGLYLHAAVFGALEKAVPDLVIGDSGAPTAFQVYYGTWRGGEAFSILLFPSGGMGARPTSDGLSATAFPTNGGLASIEIVESISPLLFLNREMSCDSGGAGRHRGGLGQEFSVRMLSEQPTMLSLLCERLDHPALGRQMGLPGANCLVRLNDGDPIATKSRTLLKTGDTVHYVTPGGGGYGPPDRRPREEVKRDLRDGLISTEAAGQVYEYDEQNR